MLFGQRNRRNNYGIYPPQATLKRMVYPGNPRSNPQSSETVPSVLLKWLSSHLMHVCCMFQYRGVAAYIRCHAMVCTSSGYKIIRK